MTENFQDKLHQEEYKQSKVAKIFASIWRELECENCFSKIFATQNMKNQTNIKHFSKSEGILKSIKNILVKLNTKEDSYNATPSIVLSKIRQILHS